MQEQVVRFTLLGKVHTVTTDQSPEDVQAIANIVEEKIKQAASRRNMQPSEAFAMVAALGVAEDLLKLRKDYQRLMSLAKDEDD